MSDTFEIATLTMAWLLGLLSPTIIRRIERRYQAKEIGAGILNEAAHLRYTLAIVAFTMRSRLGTFDSAFIAWFGEIMQAEDDTDEDAPLWRAEVQKLVKLPPGQINAAAGTLEDPARTSRPIPYDLPYLASQLGSLYLFPNDLQRRLMSIRYYLTLFNSDAEFGNTMFTLTFDPAVLQANKVPIQQNLNATYKNLARRSERLAKEIGELLQKYSPTYRS